MILLSRNSLDEFHHHWLRRLGIIWEKCWSLVLFDPARVPAVTPWYWYGKGQWLCVDFCHLNTHTKKDSYPLPRIQEALESLVGTGHFSCLDLKSRFWQIKMDKALKQYTAFTAGNLGFFECDRMLFGLCNSPATFQWLMQNCMG